MDSDTIRKLKNAVAWAQRRGLTFVRFNGKTGVSLDVDNTCPKADSGNMCKYCYRKDLLRCGRLKDTVYHDGAVSETMLQTLREFCGKVRAAAPKLRSIRTFSLSDYRPEHGAFWQAVWRAIRKAGLRVHVITKQFTHVADIAPHVDCVNVSIDSLEAGNWVPAELARRAHDNVIVRCVVLNENDHGIVKNADLITVYHGMKIGDVETYRTTATTHKKLCAKVQKEEKTATCCITGHCDTCGKCWYPKKLRK
jgi:hypothetical protein